MENFVSLRSEIVQRLLVTCRSIKVKRLFMYMAEKKGTLGYRSLIFQESISVKESG